MARTLARTATATTLTMAMMSSAAKEGSAGGEVRFSLT